jgi:hypothetical protein
MQSRIRASRAHWPPRDTPTAYQDDLETLFIKYGHELVKMLS